MPNWPYILDSQRGKIERKGENGKLKTERIGGVGTQHAASANMSMLLKCLGTLHAASLNSNLYR